MNRQDSRIPVAVLGATGSVGQRFVQLLLEHPWFRPALLTASERSAGKRYGDAATWMQVEALPTKIADMVVAETTPDAVRSCPLVFSALGRSQAEGLEPEIARAGCTVVSNASAHRMGADVPLMVPEVNPDHLGLARAQKFGDGQLLTNPNCSTIGLTLALKPLFDAFGLEAVHVVTMQAVSGAGIPGVSSYSIVDNVIPYIASEEDKLEDETRKILGTLAGDRIEEVPIVVSATCNRVGVVDGHTLCVSAKLAREASEDDVLRAWREFRAAPQELELPSAPLQPVHVLDAPDAPQPRLHRDLDKGMAASVGRLRPCPLFGWKFTTLSHNTLRGAAGGSLLVAELAVARGLVPGATRP